MKDFLGGFLFGVLVYTCSHSSVPVLPSCAQRALRSLRTIKILCPPVDKGRPVVYKIKTRITRNGSEIFKATVKSWLLLREEGEKKVKPKRVREPTVFSFRSFYLLCVLSQCCEVSVVFNVHRNHKAYSVGTGIRGHGGGGRGRVYNYRYTVTTRMKPALRWAAMRAILMFH